MKLKSIRSHLKPYDIVSRRKTTINHAFAAAIAPSDEYDEGRARKAIETLGQDPDADLVCGYCGAPAQTWDHVFATVKDSEFSGRGHRLGNLLPCCRPCNSAKGNKNWRTYMEGMPESGRSGRVARIEAFIAAFGQCDETPVASAAYGQFKLIRQQVLELLAEADRLAKIIRNS